MGPGWVLDERVLDGSAGNLSYQLYFWRLFRSVKNSADFSAISKLKKKTVISQLPVKILANSLLSAKPHPDPLSCATLICTIIPNHDILKDSDHYT